MNWTLTFMSCCLFDFEGFNSNLAPAGKFSSLNGSELEISLFLWLKSSISRVLDRTCAAEIHTNNNAKVAESNLK